MTVMQKTLKFTDITPKDRDEFYRLMQMYARELDEHQGRNTDPEILKKWTYRIIEKQSDTTRPMYLKFCCIDTILIYLNR